MTNQNKTTQFEMRASREDLQNIALLAAKMKMTKSEAVRKLIAAAAKMKPEQLKKILESET